MPFSTGEGGLLQLNHERFDFNIQFEQLFFSIIPSVVFILTALWRTLSCARKPVVVNAPIFQLIKVVCSPSNVAKARPRGADRVPQGAIAIYAALELTLLALVALPSFHATGIFLAASVLKLVAAILMIMLSVIDHSKSPKPSVLLNTYLSLTLLLDAAQTRTLYMLSAGKPELTYSNVFSCAMALKAVILLLEAKQKSSWVSWNEKDHSPEETSGIFSIGVFFWLNKLFRLGYKKVLTIDDLYPLDNALDAITLHERFSSKLEYSSLKGDKLGLLKVLVRTLWVPLLLPVLPRLALLGFTFCQPLFMEKLLNYLSQAELEANVGYGFIGASLLIYLGIATSKAVYWYVDPSIALLSDVLIHGSRYFHNRSRTMIRSILVTEIFARATAASIGRADDGAALTLMSTDIERIRVGTFELHEVWASMIQAALAAWMLYDRLGVVFVAPIAIVLVCFMVLGFLMKFTGDSQKSWMAGVQKRVGLTATVIANMKNLKISGISNPVSRFVQRLRVEELAAGARFRQIFIAAAALGFLAQLISPPVAFAFTQQTLDASTMFTCLAFISLLTQPLSSIFQGVPHLISALACLSRIQAFLEGEARHDFRQFLANAGRDTEKEPRAIDLSADSAVIIQDGNFGWKADNLILRNINVVVPKSSFTVVAGPVGSGKSTFCKALLGEIPFSEGTVITNLGSGRVGFCEQTAFLSNGSIRDNVVGFSSFDNERYTEVINATALGVDIDKLPQGDRTNVGSDGITLSGGQKQRISLARALYLQSEFLVLDDVFSGLDADTEEQVFQQVFAPGGLLRRRRSTVILCTHSIKHLPAADYIMVFDGGIVAEQGTFGELMDGEGYVQRLGLKEFSDSDDSSAEMTSKAESKPQPLRTLTKDTLALAPVTDQSRQVGDRTVYKHYAKSMGWFLTGLSVFFAILWGLFTNFPTICK
jgi:ABC-type multidrug transport system fused ATPase/permease subunit